MLRYQAMGRCCYEFRTSLGVRSRQLSPALGFEERPDSRLRKERRLSRIHRRHHQRPIQQLISPLTRRFCNQQAPMASRSTALKISHPHLWSPDDPFLYDLTVRLLEQGRVTDEVQSY